MHNRSRRGFKAFAVLLLVAACACAKRGIRDMTPNELTLEPKSASLGGMSVVAKLAPDPSADRWEATIVFSRAPDAPLMSGKDVDVQLLDAGGSPLKVLDRPPGPLPEVGGSLGNSANARFHFERSKLEPAELAVTYGGETVRFRVVPKRG